MAREPVWTRDGRRLYFRSLDNAQMWASTVELEPTFRASKPELLFTRRFFADANRQQSYDVSPDGERFLMVEGGDDRSSSADVVIVLNWVAELERLLPED